MSKIKNETIAKRPIAPLIFKKIKDKSPFEIDKKEVILKFNPDIKGLDKLFKKNEVDEIITASKSKLTKMFFIGSGGPYAGAGPGAGGSSGDAIASTGSGGGGSYANMPSGSPQRAGNGGSGIVLIAYPT